MLWSSWCYQIKNSKKYKAYVLVVGDVRGAVAVAGTGAVGGATTGTSDSLGGESRKI